MDDRFDTQLQLRGAHTSKYDGISKVFGQDDPDIIPMWVADMDFAAASPIRAALQAEVDRGYFGYFADTGPASRALQGWMNRRLNWNIETSWIRYTHGVVNGFGDILAAFSEPGDEVIVFTPVYHAFFRQTKAMGRVIRESQLAVENGRFRMDLEALEASLTGRERILAIVSPHNPGGTIWSDDELREVAKFCKDHDLILIADEIHIDLTFPGYDCTPMAVAAPDCLERLVVLTAASKAFNIAGGETGIAIVPDTKLRRKFDAAMNDREGSPNRFGMAMIRAAFDEGDDWLDAAREYIAENFRIFRERFGALPGTQVMDMQATYLVWVDMNGTGMSDRELLDRCLKDAKVAPSPGPVFGAGGSGHLRFNVALPRQSMLTAIDRLEAAFADMQ